MSRSGWPWVLSGLLLVAGCNTGGSDPPDGGDGGTCPNDLPGECVPPSPTYDGQVQALMQERCMPCHAEGNAVSGYPLATYDEVKNYRAAMLTQVYGCRMPLPDAGQLSPSERATLLHWLVCGAPQN